MVNKLPLRHDDLLFFKEMMEKYDAASIKDLKMRLYPQPVSLILAQATLESGWGTSNVFRGPIIHLGSCPFQQMNHA